MASTPTTPLSIRNRNVTIRRRYTDLTASRESSGNLLVNNSDAELASPLGKRVREPIHNGPSPPDEPVNSDTVLAVADGSAGQSIDVISPTARSIMAPNTTIINLPALPPMLLFSSCPIPLKFASPAQQKSVARMSLKRSCDSIHQCSDNATRPAGFPSADESSARNFRPRSPQKKAQPPLYSSVGSLLVSSKSASPLNSATEPTTNSVDQKPSNSKIKLPKQPTVSRFKAPRSAARLDVSLSWKADASHNFHSDESTRATKSTEMTTSTSSSAISTKLQPVTRSQRRRVSFGRLQVYYFDRAQGFDTMPASGSIALGMESRHYTMKEYSFFEFHKANELEQTQKCARWLAAANAEIRECSASNSRVSRIVSPGAMVSQTAISTESSTSATAVQRNSDFAAALIVDGPRPLTPPVEHQTSAPSSSLATVDEEVGSETTATSNSDTLESAPVNLSVTDVLNNNLDEDVQRLESTNEMANLNGTNLTHGDGTNDMFNEGPTQLAAVASSVAFDAANFLARIQDRLNADDGSKSMVNLNDEEPASSNDVPNLDETIPYRFDGGVSSSALAGLSAAGIKFKVAERNENNDYEDVADTPSRSPTSSTYSSDEDVTDEFKQLERQFLPIRSRIRRTILRQSDVDIDTSVREEYLAIERSRSDVGCDCVGACQLDTCACVRLGVGCQVDRPPFPCACDVSCTNPEGRVEYDPERVHAHFLHTIMRLKTIQKRGLEDSPLSVSPQRIKFADNEDGKGAGQLTGLSTDVAESSNA